MDEIHLDGLVFFGRHGVNPEEATIGQRFGVDLTLWLELSSAAQSDDLADTVSYSAIFKLLQQEMEGEPSRLLEHLSARLLRKVLLHDPRIAEAGVRVSKLSPPLKGSTTGQTGVVMRRSRSWAEAQPGD